MKYVPHLLYVVRKEKMYEKEIAEMFIKAFENSKTYDPESTNEEIEEYT